MNATAPISAPTGGDGVDRAFALLRANPLDDAPAWDAMVARLPGAGVFHTSAWIRVLSESYGFRPLAFTLVGNGQWRGALPVMDASSWLTGRRGIALPFSDHCGPLADRAVAAAALLDAALAHGATHRWRFLEVRGRCGPGSDHTPSIRFATHRLALERDPEALSRRFADSTRRAIRKAGESPLEVRETTDPDDFRAFYRLHCRTRRRHGLPPQPFGFFSAIHRHFLDRGCGRLFLATLAHVPVAGALFLENDGVATYKFGSSDLAVQSIRPNNLVLWHAIRHYCRNDFREIDFGRTSLHQEGLLRFKRSWGADETALDYFRLEPRTRRHLVETDSQRGWHNRAFRLLPLPLSRLAGRLLYRHLA